MRKRKKNHETLLANDMVVLKQGQNLFRPYFSEVCDCNYILVYATIECYLDFSLNYNLLRRSQSFCVCVCVWIGKRGSGGGVEPYSEETISM